MGCILFDVNLPTTLDQSLELLGRTASPLALFAIGGSLVGIGITTVNIESVLLATFKVVLMPSVILHFLITQM